jgi:gluconate kinase
MDPDDLHSVDNGKKVCLVLPLDRHERISWELRDQGDHVA